MKTTTAAAVVAGTKNVIGSGGGETDKKQEYYELRMYKTEDADKKKILENYLENALIPALGRMGIDRVGVFTNMDAADDNSVYLIIPYSSLETFSAVNPKLLKDKAYQSAAKEYFAVLQDDPVYSRIISRFYKAFEGMPVIEMPEQTAGNKPRIFELRIYESHTEEKATLKVDMFNSGEIQIMRDTELGPVFFGEALIGDDLPNLTYMLSAANPEEHKTHWEKFGGHPEWERMREMPKYADTVSKITNIFLKPTTYSQI
jgi:hypothetical protein